MAMRYGEVFQLSKWRDESCNPYKGKWFILRTETGKEGLQTWL